MRRKLLTTTFLLLLSLFFGFLTFSGSPDELVSNLEGASIRKKTNEHSQGLRFYAKLDESVKDNEHGFYLVYGKTTKNDLLNEINNSNDVVYINGKKVFKVPVAGVNKDNIYSVVLTGIPEVGYFDLISVIPYVYVGNDLVLPKELNERSVAQVALNMANSGENIDDIVSVDKIINTNKKKVTITPVGDILLSSDLYELNIKELKRQFIADWNNLFGTSLDDLVADEFFKEAKIGSVYSDLDGNDLSLTRLYKFFNDDKLVNKWSWLLEFIIAKCDVHFPTLQAKAILNDGVGVTLFNGAQLTYSIVNFFNEDNYRDEYFGIDFTNLSLYGDLKDFNDGIYVDLGSLDLFDAGKTFFLPSPKEKTGFRFTNYKRGTQVLNPGQAYTVKNEDDLIEAVYEVINYNLKFYDGGSSIEYLNRTYNVLDSFTLPEYEKDGYKFIGWYYDIDFTSELAEAIKEGTTGNINLYARFIEDEVSEPDYFITYYVNGGQFTDVVTMTYKESEGATLSIPVREGYNFGGWYLNEDLSGTPVTKVNKGTKGNKTFYAKWNSLTPSTEEKLEDAKGALDITYRSGDSVSKVTKNVTLPGSALYGATVTWTSSNSDAISNAGVVNRGNNDVVVTLTATIKLDNKSVSKTFTLTVLKVDGPTTEDKLEDAKNSLNITYSSGDSASKVTKNVTLPTSSMHDATVSWNSNNNAISSAGVVNRGSSDIVVTLTATIKLDNKTVTKTFTLTVLKVDVAPDTEYTITFNLNGGTWPKEGGTGSYANRNEMVVDFLTDFYNFVKPSGVSLNDFIHGPGKTSGFDGMYGLYNNETTYFDKLYAANSKNVDSNSEYFINQPEYNKWVALIDVIEEYTNFGVDDNGTQSFWASPWTGARRIVPFMKEENLWSHIPTEDIKAVTGKMPESLTGGTAGVTIEVPTKYKVTDNDITLPNPEKAGDAFIGWYDNANLFGDKITKISKGTTGNKTFYARYNSSTVVDPSLTDEKKVNLAYDDLKITYSSGDSSSSVTKKLTLKTTGLHATTITWTSSNVSVITNLGVVNRKENDVNVKLTATIKSGSATRVKEFNVTVKKEDPEPTVYTIKYNLDGGSFGGYKSKTELATAFLTDLRSFVAPSENLNTFMHGAGKTSGFEGTWYSNETYRAKIYGINIKTGNNDYFLSHSSYQAKWKPFADFMVSFVNDGNPDQHFWSSPSTGTLRMSQYLTNKKPGIMWSDEDMAKMPSGLSASVIYEYDVNTPTITLPNPSKSGYDFEGWYLNADFTGTKVTTIAKGSTGNKTFYAKWSKPVQQVYDINLNLNGGALRAYTKSGLIDSFLNDLYSFIKPSESLQAFKHAAGKTSGVDGTWYNNEEHRAKIYANNIKSGNNNYFLSSDLYQAKWKPLTDFMVNFVKVGNPDQDFWSSSYVGLLRLHQYFTNTKPSSAWTDANMSAIPGAVHPKKYAEGSQTIYLPNATRSGYEFVGWYTANTGGTKVTQINAGATGDKTFYARWKEQAADLSINQTRTFTASDLWLMRESASNISLTGGALRLTNSSSVGALNTKAMSITAFHELVMSWNVTNIGNATVQFQVAVGNATSMGGWFTMGYWQAGNYRSAAGESNAYASKSIDTLTNKNANNRRVKLRVYISPNGSSPSINSVSVTTKPTSWSKVAHNTSGLSYKYINVPRYNQLSIPTIGNLICSPTSMAMILNYYGKGVTVTGTAGQVYDKYWGAYGNWTINASYAGNFGLYSRVEYITSTTVLRDYINAGIPLALSVTTTSTGQLRGSPGAPSAYPQGHLIVIVGFELIGGVWHAVINDPAVYSDANVLRKYRLDDLANVMSGYAYVVSTSPLKNK